jgi:sugar O-acyltransferase (sialic acid O-acetyltransferase NeuD family)
MRLAIFGTGGMGREAYDVAARAYALSPSPPEILFVVDRPEGPVLGVEVISPDQLKSNDQVVLAVGSSAARRELSERFPNCFSLIAPTAIISPSAKIGEGALICDYAVVNNSAVVGRLFQANVFSQVSHDCIIGDFVTLSPRVSINGRVEIGDDVFIGAGAVIRNGLPGQQLKIGASAVIGAGAVVLNDVRPGATVVGMPARPIR